MRPTTVYCVRPQCPRFCLATLQRHAEVVALPLHLHGTQRHSELVLNPVRSEITPPQPAAQPQHYPARKDHRNICRDQKPPQHPAGPPRQMAIQHQPSSLTTSRGSRPDFPILLFLKLCVAARTTAQMRPGKCRTLGARAEKRGGTGWVLTRCLLWTGFLPSAPPWDFLACFWFRRNFGSIP